MGLSRDTELWRDLCRVDERMWANLLTTWRQVSGDEQLVRMALKDFYEREMTLWALLMGSDDRLRAKVFDAIVAIADYQHSDIFVCRGILMCMPHRWVVEHIEPVVDGVLAQTEDENVGESYQRYAELYRELDAGLLPRFVDKALKHENPDVRDVGRWWQTNKHLW